jgi:hypothetical protein
MNPENKFSPRINLACPDEEIFTQNIDGATEYISLEEHEHLLREREAEIWKMAAQVAEKHYNGIHSPWEYSANIGELLWEKAKEATEKPSKGS